MNISDLLDYISGRDNSKEKELESWLRESPENREQYFRLKELWAQKTAEELSAPAVLEKAVSGIRSKIRLDGSRRRYRRSAAFAWSFAACLLLFIAAGTVINNWKSTPDITLANNSEAVSLYSLPDGSRAFLKNGASLSYNNSFNKEDRCVSLTGEAYFEVKKDELVPFVVSTPQTRIKVLGTSFNVRSGERTEVVLEKGKVALCDAGDRHIAELLPGNMAVVTKDGGISLSSVEPSDYTKWRYNYRVFDSCSFDDFVAMAEERFDVRFIYDPSKFQDTYFRLAISDSDTLDDILSMMEYIANLKYEKRGRNIYVNSQ
ncbi:MAG: FecR family protein [Candidatus Cryptobacteroides sp.]